MTFLLISIISRIFSNSYINVCQKFLTIKGEYPSVVNFYTYLGLTLIGLIGCQKPIFSIEILYNFFIMGLLGTLGNYFIIKALAIGELSTLASINSYKPIVALIFGIFLLNEIPGTKELIGILFILAGTFFLHKNITFFNKATLFRFLALLLSGTEALFIKKIISLTDIPSSFFYWALASFTFTFFFAITSRHSISIKKENIKFQILLVILVAIMQYSTNYVFAHMNVAYALALFQLSTLVSIFLGTNIFKESGFVKKVIASTIMLLGSIIIII